MRHGAIRASRLPYLLLLPLLLVACSDEDEETMTSPAPRADLTVKSIGVPAVSCPGGAGTCVTTVDVEIENLGAGAAPAFNFEVTLDPAQGVVVSQPVATGLAAGATVTVTIMTPQGGNCFDPDCTISVLVDDMDDVVESDETNNTASETTDG